MLSRLTLRSLPFFCLCLPGLSQQVLRIVSGSAGEQFGSSVISAGDTDGDGFEDLLVGSTAFGGGGAISCISGKFLATGTGVSTLWALQPGAGLLGDRFGASLAAVGDLTGDGVGDFAVGAPNDDTAGIGSGTTWLINGATHIVHGFVFGVAAKTHFGYAMSAVGDVDGDGLIDLAVGAPGENPNPLGEVYVISGAAFSGGGLIDLVSSSVGYAFGSWGFGVSIAGEFDLEHDGVLDMAIGSPHEFGHNSAPDSGMVMIRKAAGNNLQFWAHFGTFPGEHLGASIDVAHDYNGDGTVDPLIGAPDWIGPSGMTEGRAVVSGASIPFNVNHVDLYNLPGGAGNGLPGPGWRFGAAVRSSGDLNHDGVADFLVGGPNYASAIPFAPSKGTVAIYSGATGGRLGAISGSSHDNLGDVLLGAIDDYDGDGFAEVVLAGSLSDNPTVDCGTLKICRLFPSFATSYCTGKVNSLGCTPAIGASGLASASSSAPFFVSCSDVINKKSGLLFYSHKPASGVFQDGVLCVKAPKRTPGQNSGGNLTGSDCSGMFSYDFTPLIQGGTDPTLVAGAEMFCQYWSRDVQSASGTSLSNGLRFVINP